MPGLAFRPICSASIVGALSLALATHGAAEPATGTASYEGHVITLTHAYLVIGPDLAAPETFPQLLFTTTDLTATIRACQTMGCVHDAVKEGVGISLAASPKLHYWVLLNGGYVVVAGEAEHPVMPAKFDETGRLTGKLLIDEPRPGRQGLKVEAEFDVRLLKELKTYW